MKRIFASIVGAGLSLLLAAGPALAHDSHTVEPGDTLSHIAAEHGTSWPELFKLNRSIIDDPDLIYPGQVLALEAASKPKPKPAPDGETSSTDVSTEVQRPGTGQITSPYGMRTHPITGVHKLHSGTDLSVGDGNAYAARAGKVTGASWNGGYGRMVTVSHGGGVETRYAHLASFRVSVGDRVDAGTVVGRIGSSGYSTGAHLHFEVLRNGEFVNPVNWL